MGEQTGSVFALNEQLTVAGKRLRPGDMAPDFFLDYIDLIEMRVHRAQLADSSGMVRLLSVVNSLDMQICHQTTMCWEKLSVDLPPGACIYTISMDLPYAQARWQAANGVIHQTLSAWRNEQFGLDYGILLKEWRLLQRSVFVIDTNNRIVYVEYVADQRREPDYQAAIDVVRRVTPTEHTIPIKDDKWMQKKTEASTTLLPEAVHISELAQCCEQEIECYLRGKFCNDRSSVELLRLAIGQQDQLAWSIVEHAFKRVVLEWLCRHPRYKDVHRLKSDEECVASTFAEFRLVIQQSIEFTTLAAALRYLFVCLNSVILDTLRTAEHPHEIQQESSVSDKQTPGRVHVGTIIDAIQQLFSDVREQRLAYLLFHCGLSPKEIVRTCPQEFHDLQEIYHLRQDIMVRLLNNTKFSL